MDIAAPHVDVHYQWLEFQEHAQAHLWSALYLSRQVPRPYQEIRRNRDASRLLQTWSRHAGIVFSLQADEAPNEGSYQDDLSAIESLADKEATRSEVRAVKTERVLHPLRTL